MTKLSMISIIVNIKMFLLLFPGSGFILLGNFPSKGFCLRRLFPLWAFIQWDFSQCGYLSDVLWEFSQCGLFSGLRVLSWGPYASVRAFDLGSLYRVGFYPRGIFSQQVFFPGGIFQVKAFDWFSAFILVANNFQSLNIMWEAILLEIT